MKNRNINLIYFFIISLALGGCDQIHIENPYLYWRSRQIVSDFKKEDYDSTKRLVFESLKEDPDAPENHLNLGLIQELTKEQDQAHKSYMRAEKNIEVSPNKENPLFLGYSFGALYNQAQLYGKEGKIDQALEYYQKALNLNPNSNEIKVNIEMLFKQQQQKGQGQGDQSEKKDKKDQEKDQDKDKEKEDQGPKNYKESPKYKPREFKGKELSEYDVKQILGEIERQEQKMRADYHRKKTKEQPRDKDW